LGIWATSAQGCIIDSAIVIGNTSSSTALSIFVTRSTGESYAISLFGRTTLSPLRTRHWGITRPAQSKLHFPHHIPPKPNASRSSQSYILLMFLSRSTGSGPAIQAKLPNEPKHFSVTALLNFLFAGHSTTSI